MESFINCSRLPFAWFLIILSLVLITVYFLRRRNNFIDLREIIADHLSIFKKSKYQLFIFFAVPLIMSFGLALIYRVDDVIVDNLNIIFSIFISMFFAIISILTAFGRNKSAAFLLVLKQTNSSAIFEVVLSVFTLILSIVYKVISNYISAELQVLFSTVIYTFAITILLNMIVLIKRLKRLFDENLNSVE